MLSKNIRFLWRNGYVVSLALYADTKRSIEKLEMRDEKYTLSRRYDFKKNCDNI